MPAPGSLWLIGAGNMGGALLERWRAAGLDPVVGDPRLGLHLPAQGSPETVVLAVKPQVWIAATAMLGERVGRGSQVVSIMAGVRTPALADRFPGATISRAMPNLPAALGAGVTGLFSPQAAPNERRRLVDLFAAAGTSAWLEDEDQFDALTAVSGSGPAYVFAFTEALASAAVAEGLPPLLAARLASATVTGAAAMLQGGGDPAAMRASVTSPQGTTAAGLAVLLPALTPLMRDAVAAAAARSRELGRQERP